MSDDENQKSGPDTVSDFDAGFLTGLTKAQLKAAIESGTLRQWQGAITARSLDEFLADQRRRRRGSR